MKNQSYKEKVRQIISHKSGLEPREINDDMFFAEDLNVGDMELTEILEELEDFYKVELLESQPELESVGNLMDLLEEKLD